MVNQKPESNNFEVLNNKGKYQEGALTGLNVFFLHHASDRVEENAEEESVVLKVDVIDDQESRVEEHEEEHLDAAVVRLADTLCS